MNISDWLELKYVERKRFSGVTIYAITSPQENQHWESKNCRDTREANPNFYARLHFSLATSI